MGGRWCIGGGFVGRRVVWVVADAVCLLPPPRGPMKKASAFFMGEPRPSPTGGGGVSVAVGVFCCSVARIFVHSGAGQVSCASGWKGSAGCSVW